MVRWPINDNTNGKINGNSNGNSKINSFGADRSDQHPGSVDDGVNAQVGSPAWISGMTA